MRDYTKKQKCQIVQHNKMLAKEIVRRAEIINKGRFTHEINSQIGALKYWLNKKLEYDSNEFRGMIRIKNALGCTLYELNHMKELMNK